MSPTPPPSQTPPCPPRPDPPGQTPPARPPPLQKTAWLVEDKEDQEELINKEELMTLMPLQRCKGLRTAVALSTASRSICGRDECGSAGRVRTGCDPRCVPGIQGWALPTPVGFRWNAMQGTSKGDLVLTGWTQLGRTVCAQPCLGRYRGESRVFVERIGAGRVADLLSSIGSDAATMVQSTRAGQTEERLRGGWSDPGRCVGAVRCGRSVAT